MKDQSYESLVAGMRKAPSYTSAEEVIARDFKVRLPDRRYIHMWNSPEISQFRGVQEEMDKDEAARHLVEREKADTRQVAWEPDVPMLTLLTSTRPCTSRGSRQPRWPRTWMT